MASRPSRRRVVVGGRARASCPLPTTCPRDTLKSRLFISAGIYPEVGFGNNLNYLHLFIKCTFILRPFSLKNKGLSVPSLLLSNWNIFVSHCKDSKYLAIPVSRFCIALKRYLSIYIINTRHGNFIDDKAF